MLSTLLWPAFRHTYHDRAPYRGTRRGVSTAVRWRQTTMWLVLMLVASACGSTAQWSSTEAVEGVGGQPGYSAPNGGLGVGPSPGTDPAASDETGTARTGQSGAVPGASSSGPTAAASRGPRGTMPGAQATVAPPPGTGGPGFTAKEIYIGSTYAENAGQHLKNVGVDANFADTRAVFNALAKDIEARGGIAGRKIVFVWFDTKSGSNPDYQERAQAACSRWTQDRRVFAAVSTNPNLNNDTLYSCLARNNVPLVGSTLNYDSQTRLGRFSPYVYQPQLPTIERLAGPWIGRAAALGYFTGWNAATAGPGSAAVKIGIFSNRADPGPALTHTVAGAVARQGHTVAVKFAYRNPSEDANRAVLQFQQAGVTHVLGDSSLTLFAMAAVSQNYYPRYSITTLNVPPLFAQVVPKKALKGSLAVGYMPAVDVDEAHDPGDVSPAERRCYQLMKQAGQPTRDRTAYSGMVVACDAFSFLASTINKGGLSPLGMHRGAAAIGSLPPASTFGMSFPKGRPDGASAVRDYGFRDACECFVYLSNKNHGM